MTKADGVFKKTCEAILTNGVDTEQRAVWSDGTPAKTRHIFGICAHYDLSNGHEFPILTLRRTAWKSALDEILWIWQKKSNNIKDLKSHIWDSWADETGSIGKAYGYQLGKKYVWEDKQEMDQVDRVLYDLSTNPNSRRIIASMWNVEDLKEMNLQPCCYQVQFCVVGHKLNMSLYQRSADMLTANNWNVIQYSMLLMLIATIMGYEPGTLMHVIGDAHIYDRHIPIVEELLNLPSKDPVIIGRDVYFDKLDMGIEGFYKFTPDKFHVNDYTYHEFNHKIPVAI